MSDVEKVGRKALSTLPGPLKRGLDGTNLQFISAPPERSSRNLPAIASVDDDSPDTIQISDPQRFAQGAPQVLAHEATHLWQNNLPPKLQQMIPPDNPQNPYDFGGAAGLKTMRAQGKRLLDLPREKEASILQHSMVEKDPAYKPWIEDMNAIPLSQIMPTKPGQQGIETTPRPPRPPATMYADRLVGKGSTPPIDYDALAKQNGGNVVHTGTGGIDYDALAQQFGGTAADTPDVEPGTGMNRYGELDTTPRFSTQLAKEALPAAGQLGIGALKGLGSDLLSHTRFAPKVQPSNLLQSLGKGTEQAGEFLVPGLGEEAALSKLPEAGLLKPAARIGYNALTSGAINKAQGGGFGMGAAAGGVGTGIGLGLKAASPAMTELAQGINTPGNKAGRAILGETSGLLPSSIRKSARGVLADLNPQLDAAARNSQIPMSLLPARNAAQREVDKAFGQGEPKMYKGVNRLAKMVHTDLAGNPLPEEVPASQGLELKRGVGKALPAGSWNPQSSNAFKGPRNAISGAMSDAFEKAVPEAAPLNRRISALIPATKPGKKLFGHALGPAAGAVLGGAEGTRRGGLLGGIEGAAAGGLGGIAAPALINTGARLAYGPGRRLIPLAVGGGLQATRK